LRYTMPTGKKMGSRKVKLSGVDDAFHGGLLDLTDRRRTVCYPLRAVLQKEESEEGQKGVARENRGGG